MDKVVLRRGARGLRVRELQGLINSYARQNLVKVDESFGAGTESAVKQFQAAKGLEPDGVVGPATWKMLRGTINAQASAANPQEDMLSQILNSYFRELRTPGQCSTPANGLARFQTPVSPRQSLASGPALPKFNVPAGAKAKNNASANDSGAYGRASFEGYNGQSYIIRDFKKFEGHQIRLLPTVVVNGPDAFDDTLKNECAQFVQYFGVPRTKTWRRGPRVCDLKPGSLPVGTVIATLRDDKYYSDYSGRSHVGIYLGHDDYEKYLQTNDASAGVTIYDQYNGAKITTRKKKYAVVADQQGGNSKKAWTDSDGVEQTKRVSRTKDGEEYYVLLT